MRSYVTPARILLALVFSAPSGWAEQRVVYQIDPARSEIVVQLFKAGVGSALAHDHVVRATEYAGRIEGDPTVPTTASIVVECRPRRSRQTGRQYGRNMGSPRFRATTPGKKSNGRWNRRPSSTWRAIRSCGSVRCGLSSAPRTSSPSRAT